MQSSKAKLVAGVLVFVGVIGVGAVIYNFVRLYSSMPSKSEIIDFASETYNALPTSGEIVSGSLVPDSTNNSDDSVESGTVTTLPSSVESGAPPKSDWLTAGQRRALRLLGIDESALPSTLTPELEACFVAKIGETRIEAIKAGGTPTLAEGVKAVACL